MRIAEVSKQYDISADTLRYYERIGLLPRVHRNASGVRDYDETDLARVKFIKCMRGANVSIEALIEYMQLFAEGDATLAARKAILEEQRDLVRERIAEMQAGLDRLDYKIAHYEDLIVEAEKRREACRTGPREVRGPAPGTAAGPGRAARMARRTGMHIVPAFRRRFA